MTKMRRSLLIKCFGIPALAISLNACSSSSSSTGVPTAPAVVNAGSYVFTATGTDGTDGDYAVLGSFVADGSGNITSASADYNLGSGTDTNVPLTGTYTIAGNVATITLTATDKSFTDTFNTNLGQANAPVTNFDATGSGMLYQQTTTGFSSPGTYAYTLMGEQDGTVTGSGNFVAVAGGSYTGGTSSYMDGQTTITSSTATGFIYAPQSDGRGQGSIQGNNIAYYVVSPTQILAIGLDARALLQISATKS